MKVYGLEGLRIVDASVMSLHPQQQHGGAVMMVAEKGADLILGNTPLNPEHVNCYGKSHANADDWVDPGSRAALDGESSHTAGNVGGR
jgi:choline dehydrogenase